MITSIDQKELYRLAKDFFTITNILITIFDENGNYINGYSAGDAEICRLIRKNPELDHKCTQCDRAAMEICRRTRKSYIYHCHMGLVEVVTPIICNNMILGYVLFGQITDHIDKTLILENIKAVAEKYHLDQDKMIAGLQDIRYCSDEYIKSTTRLLEMCANYIWLNNIIVARGDSLALHISQYIRENLREDLSVPMLCRKFNIGSSTLYNISINNFGCGIIEFIARLRDEYAKELLRTTTLSIAEIAEQAGFKNYNYFIRFFKKRNGCTPKSYQKSSGNSAN